LLRIDRWLRLISSKNVCTGRNQMKRKYNWLRTRRKRHGWCRFICKKNKYRSRSSVAITGDGWRTKNRRSSFFLRRLLLLLLLRSLYVIKIITHILSTYTFNHAYELYAQIYGKLRKKKNMLIKNMSSTISLFSINRPSVDNLDVFLYCIYFFYWKK